jgi:peptidoglycan/xylan/chitin deacetylase (PgdA/CDA1 family)
MIENLLVVTYHHVGMEPPRAFHGSKNFEFAGLHCGMERFERQIAFAKSCGYNFIDLADASKNLASGKTIPQNSLAITFDDGYEYSSLLPMLDKHRIPATFFPNIAMIEGMIPPTYKLQALIGMDGSDEILSEVLELGKKKLPEIFDIFESYASEAEFFYQKEPSDVRKLKYVLHYILPAEIKREIINDMFYSRFDLSEENMMARQLFINENSVRKLAAKGFSIGSHSISHFALTTLNAEDCKNEIVIPKKILESITGREVTLQAYPHGYLTETEHRPGAYEKKIREVEDFSKNAGYIASFDYRPDLDVSAGRNHKGIHQMLRIDQVSFPMI